MDYVFILEDDPVYRRQLEESIKTIPGKMEVKIYESLAVFADQVKNLMAHGAKALSAESSEEINIRLVICKLEFLGPNRLGLLQKTREMLVRRKLCKPEMPTQFVLTCFDDPHFQINQYKKPILANLIFKPFDRLILNQHLQMAFEGGQSKSSGGLASQKTSALVEMLKAVDVTTMSEIGFKSVSNRAFEPGSVNKYYGKDFESDRHRSVMARLTGCTPTPSGEFELEFQFFAIDSTQIANMRKKMRAKDNFTAKISPSKAGPALSPLFVIIDPDEEQVKSLSGSLQRKIKGAQVISFATKQGLEDDLLSSKTDQPAALSEGLQSIELDKDLVVTGATPAEATIWGEPLVGLSLKKFLIKEDAQNLALWTIGKKTEITVRLTNAEKTSVITFKKNDKLIELKELFGKERSDFLAVFRKIKKPINAIFVNHKEVDSENMIAWENFITAIKPDLSPDVVNFITASREFTDEEERNLGKGFTDIFFLPIDRIYILQKLAHLIPGLEILEDPVTVTEKIMPQVVKSANPVHLEEISESGLVIKYYRAIEPDEFRDFILWQPYELSAPEVSARVFRLESPGDEKNPAVIRFVSFGVKDHQAKGIRLWALNNYIAQKDKGN